MTIARVMAFVLVVGLAASPAFAQISDGVIKMGVLNDQSSLYADLAGQGSVVAARMAVEDYGAEKKGLKVEIIFADHQNKADVGSSVVNQWFDVEKVDMVVDVPNSGVALAVSEIARVKNKAFIVSGAAAGKFPTMVQAGVYAGVTHYLKAVSALKSAGDGKAVIAKMKELPTDDPLFGKGTVRADGRKVHDAYLFEVKKPAESKYPGDFYHLRATIPAAEAFRPVKDGNCPLAGS